MSYTAKTDTPAPDKYSRLRTTVGVKEQQLKAREADLHKYYEGQLNKQLAIAVEKNRAYMQAQLDADIDRANTEIQKANSEANHWREQVEIIYQLLEDTTIQAEAEIARLSAKIAELEAGIGPVKKVAKKPPKKPKRTTPKQELEGYEKFTKRN